MPGRKTKNGDDFALPLSTPAIEILREQRAIRKDSQTVGGDGAVFVGNRLGRRFAAWPRRMKALQAAAGVPGWGWHDIRRTVVSHLAEHGVAESVADSLLNHRQSATRGGLLGVYQRSNWQQERRAALDLWARLMTEEEVTSNVPLCAQQWRRRSRREGGRLDARRVRRSHPLRTYPLSQVSVSATGRR